jgi:hypothetical protein
MIMKKIGTIKTNVLLEATPDEFLMLSGKAHTAVEENIDINLSQIKYALDLKDKHLPTIKQLVEWATLLENTK